MTKARRCTLLAGIRIQRGAREDWDRLAPLHYRSHHAGAVSDIFRMVHKPTRNAHASRRRGERGTRNERRVSVRSAHASRRRGECGVRSERINGENGAARETLVGVIVYSCSPLSLAARNRATGGRYRVGRNLAAGRLVNEELRIVSRVVIAPNWRGLGLASRLVAETLPRVGTPYVEALAAMGRVHPFFEQAGMTAYPGAPGPAGSERLRSALEAVGLGRCARRSAEALEAALKSLAPAARRLAEREIERWARSYLAAKNHRSRRPERRRMLDLVARHLDSAPVYYLWRRPDTQARGEGANAREVPG
jgi:GNAT superfamily N-acetyltransferase